MKRIFTFIAVAALTLNVAHADEIEGRKVYECLYLEDAPYGVLAWSQSDWVKKGERGESRFLTYSKSGAQGLALDVTAQRGAEQASGVTARNTAFYMAYNQRGLYLYIQASEPLINDIVDSLPDPQSPARMEGLEIFFAPGIHNVPYYQIFTRPFTETVNFYDWAAPHRGYRSLESYSKVESLPLKDGFGTFVFIAWEALYDRLPLNNDYWRFSIIRWMPFSKAGGVTWGGQVHDTGNFNLIRFAKLGDEQRAAIEARVLRSAWFKFKALSSEATRFWSDEKIGDPDFYNTVLKPVIEQHTSLGESFGDPNKWTADTVEKGRAIIEDWMEFNYKVSELRRDYLSEKRFERTSINVATEASKQP